MQHPNSSPDFSEQELVDCTYSREYGDTCELGGFAEDALMYLADHYLTDQQDYPYEARWGQCRYEGKKHTKTHTQKTSVRFCKDHEDGHDLLKSSLNVAPTSVGVQAQGLMQRYSGGVIMQDCGANIDHNVVAVGYGKHPKTGDWGFKLKNSWGARYGESGFVWVGEGQCGVSTEVAWADLVDDQ